MHTKGGVKGMKNVLSHNNYLLYASMVGKVGLEPTSLSTMVFETIMFTNFIICPYSILIWQGRCDSNTRKDFSCRGQSPVLSTAERLPCIDLMD